MAQPYTVNQGDNGTLNVTVYNASSAPRLEGYLPTGIPGWGGTIQYAPESLVREMNAASSFGMRAAVWAKHHGIEAVG